MKSGAQRLVIAADLQIQMGDTQSTLRDVDGRLVLRTDSPQALWSSWSSASLPAALVQVQGLRGVGRAADVLAAHGVSLDVVGPRGRLLTLGHGTRSGLGRILTGSQAVALGSLRDVLAVLVGTLSFRRG